MAIKRNRTELLLGPGGTVSWALRDARSARLQGRNGQGPLPVFLLAGAQSATHAAGNSPACALGATGMIPLTRRNSEAIRLCSNRRLSQWQRVRPPFEPLALACRSCTACCSRGGAGGFSASGLMPLTIQVRYTPETRDPLTQSRCESGLKQTRLGTASARMKTLLQVHASSLETTA